MNGIFENVMRNNKEWCTDHLLEIINEILHMASEIKKKQSDIKGGAAIEGTSEIASKKIGSQDLDINEQNIPQLVFDHFLTNFEYFIVLLGASDIVSKYRLRG